MLRLVGERERGGRADLEASEMIIRGAMHQVGGRVLEGVLNADSAGTRGERVTCSKGHPAELVDYRIKDVTTVLGPIKLRRAYYHCACCREGVIPRDGEMDIDGTGFSPGVRRLMGRVGGKEPFDEGRRDLGELAGIVVKTKQVERVSEGIGHQVEAVAMTQRQAALSGKLIGFESPSKLYIAIDGTGVPVIPRETEGRPGKDQTGRAKTREAKLGCVFTQTSLDAEGRPVRDPGSTTYVGAIETAEEFGRRIYAEAVRRGVTRAEQTIVLGDGAPWIWNIADLHFYGAIRIVDLYHAREHLTALSKAIYGPVAPQARQWAEAAIKQLDAGDVEGVLARMARLRPTHDVGKKEIQKAANYFRTNQERMRYARFKSLGLFVGSGVVEAGCKTIIGRRLKQSGMRWTIRGANSIIALRCCELSGQWETFWENRATA